MASADEQTKREVTRHEQPAPYEPWRLVIVGHGRVETRELPREGQWVIGRAEGVELRLDDAAVSRRHAVLHLGARVRVEDVGSANGTRVRGVRLPDRGSAELLPGDTVEIGPWTLTLGQPAVAGAATPKVWPKAYLSTCLDDEVSRAATSVELLLLEPRGALDPRARAQAIGADLRGDEVLADWGSGVVAVLFLGRAADTAASLRRAALARLEALGVRETGAGAARLGDDGHTAAELVDVATRALRGEANLSPTARPTMARLERLIDRVAPGAISVLILGETGAGKEVTAQAIHDRSPRRGGPFVQLNCAALSESLIESELFGFERGAFTGAVQAKPGLLETANGGTLFLDEVGELPLSTQAKLLRVLEERRVLRVGALKPVAIDVRILSATNRDLEQEITSGRFREDLYFRLNGITLVVPPLRERKDEIARLAELFVVRAAQADRREPPRLTAEARAKLEAHAWPGNVRELRNVVERAVLLATDKIEPQHLPLDRGPRAAAAPVAASPAAPAGPLEPQMQAYERDRIVRALEATGGNQTKAAELLGIARRTLINRLEQYGIERPRKKSDD
jgi:two-component system response regulator AtoC